MSQYALGELTALYVTDESGRVELVLVPCGMEEQIFWERPGHADSMVQLALEGEAACGGFAAGHTMRDGGLSGDLSCVGQRCERDEDTVTVTTEFSHAAGLVASHVLRYKEGQRAVRCAVSVRNAGESELAMTMLASFSLGMLTPFPLSREDALFYYRIRSKWSAEGQVERGSIADLQLERSWSGHGTAAERFGQTGSLPVRKFFPFAAVEDTEHGVVWAAMLGCGSSWQMELFCRDGSLCLSGGIADFEFGHWKKRLLPGETFETPDAYLTASAEGFDAACQNLTQLQDASRLLFEGDKRLPVVYNEFCTSWGKPDAPGIAREARALRGKGVDYFVIDAGWYADRENGWEHNMGDWEVSDELFPGGLQESVSHIRDAGLKPGIWFEPEVVGMLAKARRHEEHLLKRDGHVIRSGERFFWDMRDAWTKRYLQKTVVDLLGTYGFAYVKMDYNESIGIGCDGAESLGQGLYEAVRASEEFYRGIRSGMPELCLELCASGGHRAEPSFLAAADLVSFSDAHEEPEIPVIAGSLHRLVRPDKLLVWCVVRASDSARRICYSMSAAFSGILCLSGDVAELTGEQWELIGRGLAFYRQLYDIQTDGVTSFYGTKQRSWRRLTGWQAIWRQGRHGDRSYLIVHSFEAEQEIRVDMGEGYEPLAVYEACPHDFWFKEGQFVTHMRERGDALAILWKKQEGL